MLRFATDIIYSNRDLLTVTVKMYEKWNKSCKKSMKGQGHVNYVLGGGAVNMGWGSGLSRSTLESGVEHRSADWTDESYQ